MKKNVFVYALFALLLICVMVSCNNGSSPSPAEPTRPAELKVSDFKDNYPVGATKADLVGTLLYTDSKGKITTVSIKDEGVTTDFKADEAAENKILKITYKGIDCVAKYSVIDVPQSVFLEGWYVVEEDLTVLEFTDGSKDVIISKYNDWDGYLNYTDGQPTEYSGSYTIGISPAGFTTIKVTDETYYPEGKTLYPDGEGGLQKYESYYLPEPELEKYYVSLKKEENRMIVSELAKLKYFVAKYHTDGTMDFWFVDSIAGDLDAITAAVTKYTVAAANIKFKKSGIFIKNADINPLIKRFNMYSRDEYERIVISCSGDTDHEIYGFDYVLELAKSE